MLWRLVLAVMAIAGTPGTVDAQQLACVSVRPGDTAALLSARLTGDARNRHREWFQILESPGDRVVAKSRYDRIEPGWRACLVQHPLDAPIRDGTAGTAGVSSADRLLRAIGGMARAADPALLLCGVLLIATALLWRPFDAYVTKRERTLGLMNRFGERFIREFERPLLSSPSGTPSIRWRVRASAERGRLEILAAPAGGRRYPNLADHKANVAYDLARVEQFLQDRSFVCAPPYAQGAWVVFPFQLHDRPEQAGGQ